MSRHQPSPDRPFGRRTTWTHWPTRTVAELRKEVGEVRAATDKIAQQMRLKMKKMRKDNDDFEKDHSNSPSLVKVLLANHTWI